MNNIDSIIKTLEGLGFVGNKSCDYDGYPFTWAVNYHDGRLTDKYIRFYRIRTENIVYKFCYDDGGKFKYWDRDNMMWITTDITDIPTLLMLYK